MHTGACDDRGRAVSEAVEPAAAVETDVDPDVVSGVDADERRFNWVTAAGLALLVFGIGFLFTRTFYDAYDSSIIGQVAIGLVDHGSPKVVFDAYHINTPYSFYGLLMSLLMIPGIVVAKLIGASEESGLMATNAWLLGALAAVIYGWCSIRGLRRNAAIAVALLTVLGTGVLWFVSTGFVELALALAIASGMLGLTAMRAGRSWGAVVVGVAAGAAVLARDDSAILVMPWLLGGALLLADRRGAALARLVAGGAPFAVLWVVYNHVRFGTLWTTGYSGIVKFNHSFVKGVFGLVASPGRGLLLYAPLCLVGIAGLWLAWQRDRVVTAVAGGLVLTRIVFYAPFFGWYGGGGFGPRFVVAATPVLALGLMELFREPRRVAPGLRVAAGVLAVASVAIGVVGAAVDYERTSLQAALQREPALKNAVFTTREDTLHVLQDPETARVVDRHMFSWTDFPITDEASSLAHRDDIASAALGRPADRTRLAVAALLIVAGAALLLLPMWRRPARAAPG